MQPVLERGSIDKPLSFDFGLIQLSFIPVCSPNIYMQHFSQNCAKGLHFSAFILVVFKEKFIHANPRGLQPYPYPEFSFDLTHFP